ncbi:hypothetical protein RQP46_000605 [Phenoliferia psychrophenolica]
MGSDQFARLHELLEDCIANPDQPHTPLATIQRDLERARPTFLNLLDTPPKDAAQRSLLEQKGEYADVTTGTQGVVASPELRREILFLADSLSASETLCAAYVHSAVDGKRWSNSGAESGLELYLNERAQMLQCLQTLWRGALSADEAFESSGLKQIFLRETEELVQGRGAEVIVNQATKAKGSWTSKLIHTIDSLREANDSLRRSIEQPGSTSTFALTTVKHGVSFSDDTTANRIRMHEAERNALAHLLFLIGAAQQISLPETLSLTKQLAATTSTDGVAVYLLVALMAALDSLPPGDEYLDRSLPANGNFVSQMKAQILDATWTVPHLQAATLLQWTVFLDHIVNANPNVQLDRTAHGNPTSPQGPGHILDVLTDKALNGGAVAFLARGVLAFKRDANLDESWADVVGEESFAIGDGNPIAPDFETFATEQVELLVLEIVTTRTRVLHRVRQREEDVSTNSHRGAYRPSQASGANDRASASRGHILESLFLLVATIYRDSPDSGLKYWIDSDAPRGNSSKTPRSFIRWGSECSLSTMVNAYREMVTSLATGPRSAALAFQFFADAGSSSTYAAATAAMSWETFNDALTFLLRNLSSSTNADGAAPEVEPVEVFLLRSFARLLRQVVLYSDSAREALYDNQQHRPVQTMLSIIARYVPLQLKADLLGAVAAFARPGGSVGVEIARRTWGALEVSQVLLAIPPSDGRGGALTRAGPLSAAGGILAELEELETPSKVYPQSIAFIELLNVLVHAPAPLESLRQGVDFDTQTIPDTLGAPHRAPGVDPYVRFVLDEVLLKITTREFQDQADRWKMTDVALSFVERCLACYDLGPFLVSIDPRRQTPGSPFPLAQLVVHPGFDILTRLLSASELLETIFTILIAGYDAIVKNSAGTPLFTTCVLRCMRILRRTLALQTPFLETFLPVLGRSTVHIPHDKRSRLVSLAPVDRSLLFHSEAVVQIALLVGCTHEDEIALLAVQTLIVLAESTYFNVEQRFPEQSRARLNRLVGLLQASTETDRVLQGFIDRLRSPIYESDLERGEWTGPGAGGNIQQAIRSAILDLLLQTTSAESAAPNIAHLILGFDVHSLASEIEIDPPEVKLTSLHVVLNLLRGNVATDEDAYASILNRHPTFAAKCYRLVRQLCVHKYTSSSLSRYLRNHERFFYIQSGALPFEIPPATHGALGEVTFDSRQIVTSSAAVCAILEAQAWLLESTALELNVLAEGHDTQRLDQLIRSLFLPPSLDDDDMPPAHGLARALPRILEIFHAFDITWSDSIVPTRPSDRWMALDYASCLRPDPATGCEVYDIEAIVALLAGARRSLQDAGELNTVDQKNDVRRETRAIFETIVVENHRCEIRAARLHALRAWKTLLDIAFDRAFNLFPPTGKYILAMELIAAILPPIASPETDPAISELLSTAVVLLVTKVRDGAAQIEAVNATDDLHLIIRGIFVAIVQPSVSLIVRGNLYVALVNYFQLAGLVSSSTTPLARTFHADDSMSVDGSVDGASTIGRPGLRTALDKGNAAIFLSALDRLLPTICRDAASGSSVWRGVAFSALDTLVMVAQESHTTSKLLSILSKQGYLQTFVSSLKDAEGDLMRSLEPDPNAESLAAFYIYTSQMSFLIRLASTREGAEKLLDAELFVRLSQCDYLEFDGFVPHSVERHHELLLPALQLVVGTLVAFGAETAVATQQAIAFVEGQSENLLIALRNAAAQRTGPAMREAHLIVTLMGIVLPLHTPEQLNTASGFGGLHSAMLALSAKICGAQDWLEKVTPTVELEQLQAHTMVPGLGPQQSSFAESLEQLVESLQGAVFTYHNIATRKRLGTNAFRPVWSPSVSTSASAPTLGTASLFIRDLTNTLAVRLLYAAQVAELLDEGQHRTLEEKEEALHIPDDDLSLVEREKRAQVELKALQVKYRERVTSSLHLVEVALLLYWRHLDFYLDEERSERDVGFNGVQSISPLQLPSLRIDLAKAVLPSAQKLDSLRQDFSLVTVGPAFRAKDSYIEIVLRKIKDILVNPAATPSL